MADDFSALPPLKFDEAKPGTRDYAILEWCESRLKDGQRFVQSSVGYEKIEKSISAIFSGEKSTTASYSPLQGSNLSRTEANLVAKTAEDITALLTDTRVFWNYATHNPAYEEQARISNKQAEDWYTSRCIDLRIADMIRIITCAGTAYAHLYYSRRLNDMMLDAVDPRFVFPIEPISYHTTQECLGVILRQARTPMWVKAEFNKDVAADVGAPGIFGWLTRVIGDAVAKARNGPLSKTGSGKDDQAIPATPTVFVNTMYLDDKRTNKTSSPVTLGTGPDGEDTQWAYTVKPGMPLYPFKRLIVWSTNCLLYDGPSPYWHGKFPLIKLTLNPWPQAWLGKAPLWDILSLNRRVNRLLRVIDDHAEQVAQPNVFADRNVSRNELNKFNTREPGAKVRTNSASGKGIVVAEVPALEAIIPEQIDWSIRMIQQLSGTADISQMAQLAQIPSDDTIDTIMKAMTPGVRLRSRVLEGFMKELAEMYLYCIAEFDTLPKRVAKFGPNSITKEDFDYDPNSFIPDDIPDGTPGDIGSTADALGVDGPRPKYQRAKQMLTSFAFNFKPGSLLNSAAQQDRMEDLMLSKMGYLSVFTLMENLGKMNFAPPGLKVPNSELERLQLQQQLGIGMIADAQGRKATNSAPPSLSTGSGGNVTLQTS